MAVLLETSKGDLVVDLYVDDCPLACKNFLKLCKIKYYNNCLFHNVQRNFIAQTGDPTGTGRGGSSIYGVLFGEQARFFDDEIHNKYKHKRRGTIAMASSGDNTNASQFYITLGDNLDSLDEKHTIFGEIAEGHEVLEKLNDAYVDDKGRPYQNMRIRHTIVLDDPYDDPPGLEEHIPDASPEPQFEQGDRLEDDWAPEEETRAPEEIEQESRRQEAFNRAVVLEMVGDLPEAEAKPPSNMLFVCKLNPVTTEEDLEIIFSRFGNVTSCDIIKDYKTGDSLCYAFIGFDNDDCCEEAYFKMNNVLIDDRRIKVDFSQSVHHIWKQFRKFGGKGDAAMGKDANTHERKDRNALGGKLELKPKTPGPGPRGGGHQLLLGDDSFPEDTRHGGDDRHPKSSQRHSSDARREPEKRKHERSERSERERMTDGKKDRSERPRGDNREESRRRNDAPNHDERGRSYKERPVYEDDPQTRSPKRHKSLAEPAEFNGHRDAGDDERRRRGDEEYYDRRDKYLRGGKPGREEDGDESYAGGRQRVERKGLQRDRYSERDERGRDVGGRGERGVGDSHRRGERYSERESRDRDVGGHKVRQGPNDNGGARGERGVDDEDRRGNSPGRRGASRGEYSVRGEDGEQHRKSKHRRDKERYDD